MAGDFPSLEGIPETIVMLKALVRSEDTDSKHRILAERILALMSGGFDKLRRAMSEIGRIGTTPDTKALMLEAGGMIRDAADLMDDLTV